LITETLQPRLSSILYFSDSALKNCIYYPVCRCQRTSQALSPAEVCFRNLFLSQTQNGCFYFYPTPRGSLSLSTFACHFLMVGLTGLEPVTLRLSSACSNQLSYRPGSRFALTFVCARRLRPWWRHGDSNPRPIACKATALPTELCPLLGYK
jgi:hypothetical protein